MLIKQNVNNDVDKDSCINRFLTYPGCSGGLLVKTDEFRGAKPRQRVATRREEIVYAVNKFHS